MAPTSKDIANLHRQIKIIDSRNTIQDTTLASISKEISDIQVKNTNQDTTLASISKEISDIQVKNTNQDTTLASISKEIPTNFDIAKFKYLVETYLVFDGLTISFVNPSDPYPIGIIFDGIFNGTQFEAAGRGKYKYTFPTGAEVWAGFANNDTSLYPFSFPFGGKIDFEAYVLDDVSIKFKFEKLPYPNTEPSFYTETKLITSSNRKYTIDILPQSNKTFSSFLLFLITRNKSIILSKVIVTAYEANANFIDIDSIVKDFSFFGLDWVYEVGPTGSWSNNEKQAYTKDQVEISNNSLKIKIQRQADNTINSSRIVSFYTKNELTLERNYSIKITFMAKMPKSYDVNGNILDPETVPLWPALWLMGQEFWTKKETWPSCGEIDVLEWTPTASTNVGTFTQKSVFNALHYAGGESIKNLYESVVDLIDNFNNYSTKLYRYSNDVGNKIEFYFNDILIKSHILTSNQDELVISKYGNKKFGLIMNIAYQGDFTSNIDNIAFNNATMEISNISIEKNIIE
jgi:hypothetical protein